MDPVIWEGDPPELRSPALVCAFAGWNDAASAATTALEAMAASLDPQVVARDRPGGVLRLPGQPADDPHGGGPKPRDRLAGEHAARRRGAERRARLALLSGVEPNVRWRTFAETIVDAARAPRREIVITLGALIADVAHTRPVPITGLASDPELVEQLGLSRSSYEGPTGIVGVLHDACRRRELDLREPVGAPSRTTSPRCQTRRRPWRCCAVSRG